MVTQPLLVPQRDVFSVDLLDYATPGFCTNWKPYFGSLEDIAAFRMALHQDEKRKPEDMSFMPVKVYGTSQQVREAGMYEHTNIWGYPTSSGGIIWKAFICGLAARTSSAAVFAPE